MPDEIQAPWQKQTSPFVSALNKFMMGIASAITALPNQFWGMSILTLGAIMIPHATEKTLAIIGGIIAAGAQLLVGKGGNGNGNGKH